MAAKPLTSDAILPTEKRKDVTLDEIIILSKRRSAKAENFRISNKSQRTFSNAAEERSLKSQGFMESRSSLRQGSLAHKRSNFQPDHFPIVTEAARKAASKPLHGRAFHRDRVAMPNKPRTKFGTFVENEKPLISDALTLTEKKVDMTSDELVKTSNGFSTRANKFRTSDKNRRTFDNSSKERSGFKDLRSFLQQRKSQRTFKYTSKERSSKLQGYMELRSSLQQNKSHGTSNITSKERSKPQGNSRSSLRQNKNRNTLNNNSREGSLKLQGSVDSTSSLQQGALAHKKLNVRSNQLSLATEADSLLALLLSDLSL